MTTPQSPPTYRPDRESFDRLYRGEPAFDGAPPPTVIPWDVGQAQPGVMELEALGGFSGDVLDVGCGLGDNAIYLASRGHTVTGLDGSAAAIEQARSRAAAAGVAVTFQVADATDLGDYAGRFDTVVDSALYHCLDEDGRQAYAAGLYRATRPGARLHLYCFSEGTINGVISPMRGVPVSELRETLTANGWRIDFLGPTTYLGNASGFGPAGRQLPEQLAEQLGAEEIQRMQEVSARFERVADLLDDGRVHLPFTVVHAHRVD